GLGCVLLSDLSAAAAGALLAAMTIEYPYLLHYWSIWPMGAAILMALALLTVGAEYLRRPSRRWAVLGGVLVAGILATHGTELYTSLVGLLVLVVAEYRRAAWRRLPADMALAAGFAALLVAPYVPSLAGWAAGGGAVSVGYEWFDHTQQVEAAQGPGNAAQFWLGTISSGVVIDVPIRAALLAAGVWWSVRARRGRSLIGLCVAFALLVAMFAVLDLPVVQAIFARTHPWGVPNRLAMVIVPPAALLSGAGLVELIRGLSRVQRSRSEPHGAVAWRRATRLAAILGVSAAVGTTFALSRLVAREANATTSYSPDDAVAMSWLRQHASPGDVMVNDGPVDAGIWAPYKAGVRIVSPRLLKWAPAEAEELLRDNVGHLDRVPAARDAACALGVSWVYAGVAPHDPPELGHFPPLSELRSSTALQEMFSTDGGATIFHVRLDCAGGARA
ncbi:MAG TPA: DUF6541 family protein, partial [Longimicrobiales bacterium]